jgi:hypothetical protein
VTRLDGVDELPHDRFVWGAGMPRHTACTARESNERTFCRRGIRGGTAVWDSKIVQSMCTDCDTAYRAENNGRIALPPFETPDRLAKRAAALAQIHVGDTVGASHRTLDMPTNAGFAPSEVLEIETDEDGPTGIVVVKLLVAPRYTDAHNQRYAELKVGKTFRHYAEFLQINS